MSAAPELSVVIPARDAAPFIGEALASVAVQEDGPTFEILVVDDASEDGTAEAAGRAAPEARVLRLERASGSAAARNSGVRESRAPLVAFLDADDLWVPEKTRLQLERLAAEPELGFVFSDMIDFDEEGEAAESYFERKEYRGPADLTSIFLHDMVSTPTVVVRREVLERAGPFDESLPIGQDTDLWFRLARLAPFASVEGRLVRRRRHGGNVTRRERLLAECTEEVWGRYRGEALARAPERAARVAAEWNAIRAHRRFLEGAAALREGDLARGRAKLDEALELQPGHVAAARLRLAARLGRPGLAVLRGLFGKGEAE